MNTKKKEFRAMNVSDRKSLDIKALLHSNGIDATMYRINHFSNQKELVAEKSVFVRIKTMLG